MKLFIIIAAIVLTLLYIMFSDPKSARNVSAASGRDSILYRSSIRNSYPSTKEVFQTLDEADIPACFLEADLSE